MNYFHLWVERDLKSLFLCIEEERLAFYYLPKCGCSSIRKLIETLSNIECLEDEERLRFVEKPRCLLNESETNKILCKYGKSEGFKTIAIVRNPYDRIISAFQTRDWLVNYRGEQASGEVFSSKYKTYDDFKQFIDILIKQDPNFCNVHFTPQKLLMDGILPDVLLKLEDLDAINSFLKNEGIQPMPHENASSWKQQVIPRRGISSRDDKLFSERISNKNKSTRPDIFNLLKKDKETQKKIEEYYSVDFDFLDYAKLSDNCS